MCSDARDAVDGAHFVQESIPERVALKHALYAGIEDALDERAIVASSASGLTLSELQPGWRDPSSFVLGHPFNPPHLIPLVEVMGNERTGQGVVARARTFYESVGKVTIEVRREVPGHVANRLQAALWREAIHLVNEGVASVVDVDRAVSSGPGLRWAAMGPTQLFHLGADDGLAQFCDHYADSFNRWWDDLGTPHLDDGTVDRLVTGLEEVTDTTSYADLAARRDDLVAAVVAATHPRYDEFTVDDRSTLHEHCTGSRSRPLPRPGRDDHRRGARAGAQPRRPARGRGRRRDRAGHLPRRRLRRLRPGHDRGPRRDRRARPGAGASRRSTVEVDVRDADALETAIRRDRTARRGSGHRARQRRGRDHAPGRPAPRVPRPARHQPHRRLEHRPGRRAADDRRGGAGRSS